MAGARIPSYKRAVENAFFRAVGRRIADLCNERGSDSARAGRPELRREYVSRVESKAENVSLSTISRLALALGVEPSELLSDISANPAVLRPTDD